MTSSLKKHILITGGNGFVGSRLVSALIKRGFKVTIADSAKRKIGKTNINKNVKVHLGDLKDKKFTESVMKGVEIVVHLAADIGSLTYMDDYQADILLNNTAIDIALYPAMLKAGVRTVIYSSSSMVFQNSTKYPYSESDLKSVNLPNNTYGFSKLSGEYFCQAFQKQYGLKYVILRYHNIYGPGELFKSRLKQDDGLDYGKIHVLPALIHKVISGQYPLEIIGNPKSSRPFTYIDDAVEATVRIVEEVAKDNPKVINTDFNIGPKDATKIIDAAKIIWKLIGDERKFKYIVKKTKATTADRREMNPNKINRIIDWSPSTNLKTGLKILIESIKE